MKQSHKSQDARILFFTNYFNMLTIIRQLSNVWLTTNPPQPLSRAALLAIEQ